MMMPTKFNIGDTVRLINSTTGETATVVSIYFTDDGYKYVVQSRSGRYTFNEKDLERIT